MFVSGRMEKELKEVSAELVEKREAVSLFATLAVSSAAGAFLKLIYLAALGAGLMLLAWLLYRKVARAKAEALEEAWSLLISTKGLEAKALHEPEKRDELENMIKRKKKQFDAVINKMKELNKELKEIVLESFALYGAGAGLLASSLASEFPKPFNYVTYVIFVSLMLLPVPTIVTHLRSSVPQR